MLSSCRQLDLRKLGPVGETRLAEARAALPAEEALFVLSASRPTHVGPLASLVLVPGPSAYFWVEFHPLAAASDLGPLRREHAEFLQGYQVLVRRAQAGDSGCLEDVALYTEHLAAHLRHEEEELYPRLDRFLGNDRCTRELGYEHQGIRRYLAEFPAFLQRCLEGGLSRKEVERFELHLFHLMEHHIEREEAAVYPLLERLAS